MWPKGQAQRGPHSRCCWAKADPTPRIQKQDEFFTFRGDAIFNPRTHQGATLISTSSQTSQVSTACYRGRVSRIVSLQARCSHVFEATQPNHRKRGISNFAKLFQVLFVDLTLLTHLSTVQCFPCSQALGWFWWAKMADWRREHLLEEIRWLDEQSDQVCVQCMWM